MAFVLEGYDLLFGRSAHLFWQVGTFVLDGYEACIGWDEVFLDWDEICINESDQLQFSSWERAPARECLHKLNVHSVAKAR